MRDRFNARQFISWLQDVDDKYDRMKVRTLCPPPPGRQRGRGSWGGVNREVYAWGEIARKGHKALLRREGG